MYSSMIIKHIYKNICPLMSIFIDIIDYLTIRPLFIMRHADLHIRICIFLVRSYLH